MIEAGVVAVRVEVVTQAAIDDELRRRHNLAGSPVVKKLPGESLKRLLSAMELLRLEPETVIAREGSEEAFLLLIVQGVVEATIESGGHAGTPSTGG